MGETRMEHSIGSGDTATLGRKNNLESLPMLDDTMQFVRFNAFSAALALESRSDNREAPRTALV
eukprot:CAMPEP_0178747524 /NCGR_PEP_ID=MMETSP0744-20121128/8367_1 /TAXON_ID=913974 /ORGANISM="Nitzschia punctata, Strain CCMP561" /LENGTH=63 /DNA_ID=CAMNT_0020400765 /DNA_START=239 /DNA_END=426 /DNA_ORIENTATION=+